MQAFLESFKTTDEVYRECKKRGIKGESQKCQHCVIAELLKSEFPGKFVEGFDIEVVPNFIWPLCCGEIDFYQAGEHVDTLPLPRVVNVFLVRFHLYEYPDLVKESTNDR